MRTILAARISILLAFTVFLLDSLNVSCFVTEKSSVQQQSPSGKARSDTARYFFGQGGPGKSMSDDEKERQFREQQEILARRRDPNRKKKYYEDMEKRREEYDQNIKSILLKDDGKDPLIQWRKKREAGVIKDFKYEEGPKGSLPIPGNPIQIPRFDNGERFDLRLPYVDRGYEDPDADVMGKMFGRKKKAAAPAQEPPAASSSKTKAAAAPSKAVGRKRVLKPPPGRAVAARLNVKEAAAPPATKEEGQPAKKKGWFGF